MRYLFKTFLVGVIIGLVLSVIFVGIEFFANGSVQFDREFFIRVGHNLFYSVILTIINSSFFDYLNHRVVWKKYGRYRLVIGAVGGIVLTMFGILFIRILIRMGFEGASWEEFLSGERAIHYLIALLITIVFTVFFHAFYFYRALQDKKVKEQKIIAGTASAKFDALKNQLDPHFLFNSLNVLTSLIEEDPDQAQKFTTSLSKVYRYVLEQKNKDLVTVDEELQFAKTYIRLLKMRFEDSIVFDIPEKCSNPEAKIVPLSLQLLLENAVKHNVATSTRPLHIKVFEDGESLVIQNNLQEKQVVKKSSGVGLRNIQQRYSILSDKEVEIIKTSKDFTILLPMLTKMVSMRESQQIYISDKRYQKAKERVESIKGFYGNLTAYCIVIPFLIWLNFKSTSFPWAIFPALGWGFGLLMHGMEAYGYNPLWGKNWEEKKIKELMDNDKF
ncbi:2TM domain-containing protein [uncultured Eudoraea sp.]|uniref:2TM domain-containing protein n=1 Tax=uncultured Eudoraea sp. TaxID=1035614 RepID=UPI00260E628B|nr:2TM domain-containing protein [uncultured Eudoraea sp.]